MNANATPVLIAVLIVAIIVSTWLITGNQNRQNDLLGELIARLETTGQPNQPEAIRVRVQSAAPPGATTKPEPEAEAGTIVTEVLVTDSQSEAAGTDPGATTETKAIPVRATTPDPGSDPGAALWQAYGPTIEQVITDLMAGRDEAVTKRFTKEYAHRLTSADIDINATMQRIREQNGALLRITSHKRLDFSLPPNQHAFRVATVTENNNNFVFTITITDDKQIEGMQAR